MRIGIDAMGGDYAPTEPVLGAVAAKELLGPEGRLVLIGEESVLRKELAGVAGWESFIDIHHASQAVGMDEPPVEAMRSKPDSSIARMAELHARGQVDAVISAGNTGACVAACQMRLRRLPGVARPGIAIIIPTYYGPVTLCDVGANVNCRPHHLHQYAIMSEEYGRAIAGIEKARVGLLSIGEEDAKGNTLVKETRRLLRDDPTLNFIGNVEGRDIFRGTCDVVVCEGFVGNVCLKLMEGLAEGLFKSLAKEAGGDAHVGGPFQKAVLKMRDRFDFNEYGGAPLLGVAGVCIICHGASQRRAITNAVRVAKDSVTAGINARITDRLAQYQGMLDG